MLDPTLTMVGWGNEAFERVALGQIPEYGFGGLPGTLPLPTSLQCFLKGFIKIPDLEKVDGSFLRWSAIPDGPLGF